MEYLITEDQTMTIETDSLTEQYTLKIPEILKVGVSSLSPSDKKRLNNNIMIIMAKEIHRSKFNPKSYLSTNED